MNAKQQQHMRTNQRRKQQGRRGGQVDIWRAPAPLPELDPIALPREPSAMLRSLGDPPMNNAVAAGHYFSAVVERVSGIARALAMSVDLLDAHDRD